MYVPDNAPNVLHKTMVYAVFRDHTLKRQQAGTGFFSPDKAPRKPGEGAYIGYVTEPGDEGNAIWRKKDKPEVPGDIGEGVPPVPIPNTAVKPFSADDTWS